MDGISLTEEYIEIVKKDPEKYYRDYLKAKHQVENSNAKYKGKPIPFLYEPMFLTKEDLDKFNEIGRVLFSIGNKVTDQYIKSPEYRKKFRYPKLLEELLLVDPGYSINVPIGRFDLFYGGGDQYKFIEVNTDGTSGMNEDNIFSKILLNSEAMKIMKERYKVDYFELMDKWVEESLKTYASYKNKVENPTIAIVDFMETGITAEFEEFIKVYEKKGYQAYMVDARDLKYNNGKLYYKEIQIHMIYRRIVTAELIEKAHEVPDLIQAYKEQAVCFIGSLRSQILHNKMIFKVLHEEETLKFLSQEEINLIKNHIPITKEFKGKEETLKKVINNKEKYILKPIDSFASQGVNTGRDFTQEGWEVLARECFENGFLYQEFIDPYTRPFIQFEEEGLTVKEFNLNVGVYMYNEKVVGVYNRISRDNIIFGNEGYFSIPSMLVQEK